MKIEDLRRMLDDLDSIIITVLGKRMSYIPEVAKYKAENGIARYQQQREQEIIEQRRMQAETLGLNPDLAEEVMRTIIKYAHLVEQEYLGE